MLTKIKCAVVLAGATCLPVMSMADIFPVATYLMKHGEVESQDYQGNRIRIESPILEYKQMRSVRSCSDAEQPGAYSFLVVLMSDSAKKDVSQVVVKFGTSVKLGNVGGVDEPVTNEKYLDIIQKAEWKKLELSSSKQVDRIKEGVGNVVAFEGLKLDEMLDKYDDFNKWPVQLRFEVEVSCRNCKPQTDFSCGRACL